MNSRTQLAHCARQQHFISPKAAPLILFEFLLSNFINDAFDFG